MSYFGELRQLVDHRRPLTVAATVLVVDDQVRLLLLKRSSIQGWRPSAGARELDETLGDATRRETRAEPGPKVGPLAPFGIFSGPQGAYCHPNSNEVDAVGGTYLARDSSAANRPSERRTQWDRFALGEGPPSMSSPDLPIRTQRVGNLAAAK